MQNDKNNPFVGIAGIVGGFSVGVVAVIAILASNQLMAAVWVVGILALMGISLGIMAYLRENRDRRDPGVAHTCGAASANNGEMPK